MAYRYQAVPVLMKEQIFVLMMEAALLCLSLILFLASQATSKCSLGNHLFSPLAPPHFAGADKAFLPRIIILMVVFSKAITA